MKWVNRCGRIGRADHFGALLKAAKLPAMRIYDLRHSSDTILLEVGEELAVISKRLGHSTLSLTNDTYVHTSRAQQESAASKLDGVTRRRKRTI